MNNTQTDNNQKRFPQVRIEVNEFGHLDAENSYTLNAKTPSTFVSYPITLPNGKTYTAIYLDTYDVDEDAKEVF